MGARVLLQGPRRRSLASSLCRPLISWLPSLELPECQDELILFPSRDYRGQYERGSRPPLAARAPSVYQGKVFIGLLHSTHVTMID